MAADGICIGGFQPFSLSDFPGRAAAILFTQGCNWRCPFCHNRSLWTRTPPEPPIKTAAEVYAFLKERQGRLGGLVVTGGEPTLQEELSGFLGGVKSLGLAVKLDTNGSRPEVVEALLAAELVDYIAMDVKAPVEKYDQLCGCPVDMDAVRRTMALIADSGRPHHFRTTFYPDLLSEADIEEIQDLIPPRSELKLQAYQAPHP